MYRENQIMSEKELREQFVNLFKNAYELFHESEEREVGLLLELIIDDVVDKFRDGASLQSLEARMNELFEQFFVLDEKYRVI